MSNPNRFARRRDDLGRLLNECGLIGEGVEVGVFRGDYSEVLISTWRGTCLHLVDPFRHIPEGYFDGSNVTDEEHAANLDHLHQRLRPFADRYRIHRAFSVEAASQFADNSLDFVYIDANHAYRAVHADLHAWYPKLGVGGLFAGHEYVDFEAPWGRFAVKRAVDEFARDSHCEVLITPDDAPRHFPSWYFFKSLGKPSP